MNNLEIKVAGLKKKEKVDILPPEEKSYKKTPQNILEKSPYSLYLGNLCNNNCSICKLLACKNKKNKTILEIKEELSQLKKGNEILILGGDPLLRKDLDRILDQISSHGFKKIGIKTNGRLLSYGNFADKISKHFDYFVIKVYGHTPALHDSITKTTGSFLQTLRGLNNMISRKKEIELELVITSLNYRYLINCVDFFHDSGIKKIRLTYPVSASGFEKYIPTVTEEVVRNVQRAINYALKNGIQIIRGENLFNPTKPEDLLLKPTKMRKTNIGKKVKPKVSIIIPTYNRKDSLKLTLVSLFNQTYPSGKYEIIVIDDGSTDNTEEVVKSLKPKCGFKYVYWPREKPYVYGELGNRAGPARNLGIIESEGDVLLFIDSDMIADPNLIKSHMRYHDKYPSAVVIGYRYWLMEGQYNLDSSTIIKDFDKIRNLKVLDDLREPSYSLYGDDMNKIPGGWDHFHTNNASVAKRHVIDVGGFDPSFISWSTEDNELGYRLYKKGLRFFLARKSVGYHLYNKPEFIDAQKNLQMNLYAKNIFYKKHLDKEIFDTFRMIFNHLNCNEINIGNRCNNNCTVCAGLDKKQEKILGPDDIKRMETTDMMEILVSGGEPVLNENFNEIMNILRKNESLYVSVKTNGRPFSDPAFAERVAEKVNGVFCVYAYGKDSETHESITGVKNSFSETIRGIKNLLSLGKKVSLIIPITNYNYKDLHSIVEYFISLGVKWFTLYYPHQPHDPSLFMLENCNLENFKQAVPPLGDAIHYVKEALWLGKDDVMIKANLYYFEI